MNDNFDFNNNENKENEILMSESEKKSHKMTFSKLCLAFLSYLLIVNGLSVLVVGAVNSINPALLESYNFSMIVSAVIQYVIGLPLLILMLRKMPASAPEKSSLGLKGFLQYAVISMFFMYVGNYLSQMILVYMESLLGFVPENSLDSMLGSTSILLSALIVGIIGPIVEEVMFRKLFIDRLTPYGEVIAILFPSLMFGLFHGNLYQFFYAFFLGIAFSYIYVKTGKIIYSTILHMFINLFCGVFPAYIMSKMDIDEFLNLVLEGTINEEYIMANAFPIMLLSIYEFVILGMTFAGIFALTRSIRSITFKKGEVRFPGGVAADVVLFNPGTIALITVCIIIMALNTFAV